MQSLGGKDMRLDHRVTGLQCRGLRSNLICKCRQADVDTSAATFILAVERLVRGELLEQDLCQQVRPGRTAWRDVQWCGWLRDLLARAAGELLPHRLDNLPPTRDDFKVSVMSSPSFDSLNDPQQAQYVGAAMQIADCAGVITAVPSAAYGHMKLPRSSSFVNRQAP